MLAKLHKIAIIHMTSFNFRQKSLRRFYIFNNKMSYLPDNFNIVRRQNPGIFSFPQSHRNQIQSRFHFSSIKKVKLATQEGACPTLGTPFLTTPSNGGIPRNAPCYNHSARFSHNPSAFLKL